MLTAVHVLRFRRLLLFGGLLCAILGIIWSATALRNRPCIGCSVLLRADVTELSSGTAAAMTSPLFAYSPGWRVSPAGADPAEPGHPDGEPAGVITFTYRGRDLALLLAPGNYWAYLYATVDGQPANRLAQIAGNRDSQDQPAGYTTLLAPERAGAANPAWVVIHRAAAGDQAHSARLEFWRGWSQTPLRGVAVDPAESAGAGIFVLWPGVLLTVMGLWAVAWGAWPLLKRLTAGRLLPADGAPGSSARLARVAPVAAGLGLGLAAAGTALASWPVAAAGVLLLAAAGVVQPVWWLAALLFGLPFAYGVKLPLLPQRSFSLIDLGVVGGVVILAAHWLIRRRLPAPRRLTLPIQAVAPGRQAGLRRCLPLLLLAVLASWALVSAAAARYPDLALREWRTVFLNGLIFGALLAAAWSLSADPGRDRWRLAAAWLAGGAAIACFGLWGFAFGGAWVSQAEGVRRVQSFFDSANNLALYLDRTVAFSLALVLLARGWRRRLAWALLAAPQILAWLLTFSKGSLVLALPAMLLVLGGGGIWALRRQQRSLWPLAGLAAAALAGLLLIAPFLGAARFQRLFDLGQGTSFLRVQLWRSAWQMALDHPLLGVGPDNFLYTYRSRYLLPAAWQEPNLNHPHNLLLDLWTRLGLAGLALGMAWLAAGIWGLLTWLRRGRAPALALGALAAAAAGLAHGLIDVSYALPELLLVWVFLFQLPDDVA